MNLKKHLTASPVNMLDGPVFASIFRFYIPILVSSVFQALYNAVDVMLVGNMLGSDKLAAIGAGMPVYDLLIGFAFGMGSGLTVVTARSFGSRDRALLRRSTATAIVIAAAVAVVDADRADAFLEAARQAIDTELESCALTDPNAVITVAAAELPEKALSRDMTRDTLAILTEVHDGVNTMSSAIPGLVESSANTGVAALEEDAFSFMIHQRSSEPAVTADMKKVFLAQAERYGYALTVLTSSPAWPVKAGSELVEICRKEYRALTGEEIRVEPVHAGLECGGFSHSNPALDIISIGPTILDIHSPRETLLLDTVYGCDALVRNILKDIALK